MENEVVIFSMESNKTIFKTSFENKNEAFEFRDRIQKGLNEDFAVMLIDDKGCQILDSGDLDNDLNYNELRRA